MAPKNIFRIVVGLALALTFASVIAAALPGEIPESWNTVLQWSGNGGIWERLSENIPESFWGRVVLGVVVAAVAILGIAVQVGMFLFWRFARAGYVLLTGLLIVTVPFEGLVVMVPVEAALYQLDLIVTGAVIAIAYLQPVSRYFEKDA
jgi:ABC-type glycerol-3-phosphate transport system permease component